MDILAKVLETVIIAVSTLIANQPGDWCHDRTEQILKLMECYKELKEVQYGYSTRTEESFSSQDGSK